MNSEYPNYVRWKLDCFISTRDGQSVILNLIRHLGRIISSLAHRSILKWTRCDWFLDVGDATST